ncbi:hypothetical protein LZ30DRAFT_685477 [Colletotrichum cereale]|nr:hypothetical protein LZ30DRAFT_685477 [Colletotrichum cereale]
MGKAIEADVPVDAGCIGMQGTRGPPACRRDAWSSTAQHSCAHCVVLVGSTTELQKPVSMRARNCHARPQPGGEAVAELCHCLPVPTLVLRPQGYMNRLLHPRMMELGRLKSCIMEASRCHFDAYSPQDLPAPTSAHHDTPGDVGKRGKTVQRRGSGRLPHRDVVPSWPGFKAPSALEALKLKPEEGS